MAEKRMFAKSIVLSDDFLDMPATTRCLYFTLNMLADDDGFVNSPKSIMRQCMATEDDMRILLAKCYLIPFESGIVVIRHWRINNYLRCDRYTPTKYLDEKAQLLIEKDGSYSRIESPVMVENTEVKKIEIEKKEPKEENLFVDFETHEEKAAEAETSKKNEKKTVPLLEREPKNDIEKVEKAYLENYSLLYKSGIVKLEKPVVNWSVCRKLTKEVIKKYGVDMIIGAVKKSLSNDFCVMRGYPLTTILSAGVLSELINGGRDPPKIDLSEKYDMSDLLEA